MQNQVIGIYAVWLFTARKLVCKFTVPQNPITCLRETIVSTVRMDRRTSDKKNKNKKLLLINDVNNDCESLTSVTNTQRVNMNL